MGRFDLKNRLKQVAIIKWCWELFKTILIVLDSFALFHRLFLKLFPSIIKPTYDERRRILEPLFKSKIHWGHDGQNLLKKVFENIHGCMVTRLGTVELNAISFYLKHRKDDSNKLPYSFDILNNLHINAGFFPLLEDQVDAFCRLYIASFSLVDYMAVFFIHPEEYCFVNTYCPGARLINFLCLEPFLWKDPWSTQLMGKKVLVIHPFAKSIESQYKNKRTALFKNQLVLPEFELLTIKAPQTIAGNTDGFSSWFEAFEETCNKISDLDFDVAIIGAGAYGLPLAAFVKKLGKIGLHIGGPTQLLFGVKGRRWENEYDYGVRFFNEDWVYPAEEECPPNLTKVEGGCYW